MEAMALVDDYTDTLVQLDDGLRANSTPTEDLTRMSPMAQARYLLGSILLDEAKSILASGGDRARVLELLAGKTSGGRTLPGAFQHFMNVFLQYANTKWALEAGAKAEEARAILEKDLRKQIKINVDKSMWAKVEAEQLKNAKASLNLQQYAEAADQYLAVLARFPDCENTIPALYDLATCYMELNDDLYAEIGRAHV